MVKIPKSKKLYSDEGGFDYIESDPEPGEPFLQVGD